jgi:hypothetical protein
MSWVARTSLERPYVIAWWLFWFWVNGWLATLLLEALAGPDALLPQFLPGQGIPRTLYANLASVAALGVVLALTAAQLRLTRRLLPALDGGRDTAESRRTTGVLLAVTLPLLVVVATSTFGVDPFSAVVLGLPLLALAVEWIVLGVSTTRGGPAASE